MRSQLRRWRIKLFNWEYWPWQIVYIPVFIYWLLYAIRSGSLLYMCGANPKIRNGGMIHVSKFDILCMIPQEYRPRSVLVDEGKALSDKYMIQCGLTFPVIAKPDVGERGFMVRKINSIPELTKYASELGHRFILQEYVDMPVEAGIFYYRYPAEAFGYVSSVVLKKMLTVTGDGQSTLGELIRSDDRAFLQYGSLARKYSKSWNEILPKGKEVELVSIGNHCLGTTFLNGNHLINEELIASVDQLSKQIEGFYYGRFDVRAASLDDLQSGKFKVLELNGAASEPAHIYHPGASFLQGQKSLFRHWNIMFRISRLNRQSVRFPSIRESLNEYKRGLALKSLN